MKAKEGAEERVYHNFMEKLPRWRSKGSQSSFDSSTEGSDTSSGSSSETEESGSLETSNSKAKELDLGPDLP